MHPKTNFFLSFLGVGDHFTITDHLKLLRDAIHKKNSIYSDNDPTRRGGMAETQFVFVVTL